MEFNASITPTRSGAYAIEINDGVVRSLRDAVNCLDEPTIGDVLDEVARELFVVGAASDEAFRMLAYGGLMFVVLHEVSHLTCGHFGYFAQSDQSETASQNEMAHVGENTKLPIDTALVRKMAELEADAIAYDLMYAISAEICRVNSAFVELLKPDVISGEDVPEEARQLTEYLMFLSAVVGIALMEANRGTSANYPRPLTRLFNVSSVYIQKLMETLDLRKESDGNTIRFTLTEEAHARLGRRVAQTVVDAFDFVEATCHAIGVDLRQRFDLNEDENSIVGMLSRDLMEFMTNAPHRPLGDKTPGYRRE